MPMAAALPNRPEGHVRAGRPPLMIHSKRPRIFLAVLVISSIVRAARVEHNVPVIMRDGVKLMTDIYRPDAEGSYPVLVLRTPYERKKRQREGNTFAAAGYIVVTEDVRGRYDSGGDFDSFMVEEGHDGVDGYDTIEWA